MKLKSFLNFVNEGRTGGDSATIDELLFYIDGRVFFVTIRYWFKAEFDGGEYEITDWWPESIQDIAELDKQTSNRIISHFESGLRLMKLGIVNRAYVQQLITQDVIDSISDDVDHSQNTEITDKLEIQRLFKLIEKGEYFDLYGNLDEQIEDAENRIDPEPEEPDYDPMDEAYSIDDPFIVEQITRAKEIKAKIKRLKSELEDAESEMKEIDADLRPVFDSMKELDEKVGETETHLVRIAAYSYSRTDIGWKSVVEYAMQRVDDAAKEIIAEGHAIHQKQTSVKHSFEVTDKQPIHEGLVSKFFHVLNSAIAKFKSIFRKNIVEIDRANSKLEKLEYE